MEPRWGLQVENEGIIGRDQLERNWSEEWERRKLKMYKRLSRERFEDGFGFFELRGLLESDLEFMYFGDFN